MMKRLIPLLLAAAPVWACEGLQVSGAWIREAPPGAEVMAGYVTLRNPGAKLQTVCHLDSPDFGAIEMHQTIVENGLSKMLALDELEVPARGEARLVPGGLHLMLFRPQRTLKSGDKVQLNFHCGGKQPLSAVFPVQSTP